MCVCVCVYRMNLSSCQEFSDGCLGCSPTTRDPPSAGMSHFYLRASVCLMSSDSCSLMFGISRVACPLGLTRLKVRWVNLGLTRLKVNPWCILPLHPAEIPLYPGASGVFYESPHILAFTRYCFTSRRVCTSQSSVHSSGPTILTTLLQYYCTAIEQYTTPPRPHFGTPYAIPNL